MSRYRKRSFKASYNDDVAPAEEDEDEPESPSARRRRIYGSASSSDDDDRTFVLPASPVAPAGRGRGNPARGGRGNAGRRNNVPDDDGPIDIGGTPPPSGAGRGRGNAPRPRPARRPRGDPSLGREPVFPNQNYRPADDDEDDDNGDDEVVYMGTAAELAANASIPANVRNGRQREERLMNMINSDVPPRMLASRPAPRVPRAAVAMAATATYPPPGFFPAPMGVLNQATATPVDSQRNARGRLEDRRLYWNNSSIMWWNLPGNERTAPPSDNCKICAGKKKRCDVGSVGYPCTRCQNHNPPGRCVNGIPSVDWETRYVGRMNSFLEPFTSELFTRIAAAVNTAAERAGNDAGDGAPFNVLPSNAGSPIAGPSNVRSPATPAARRIATARTPRARPRPAAPRPSSNSPDLDSRCVRCRRFGYPCTDNRPCRRCVDDEVQCDEQVSDQSYKPMKNVPKREREVDDDDDMYGSNEDRDNDGRIIRTPRLDDGGASAPPYTPYRGAGNDPRRFGSLGRPSPGSLRPFSPPRNTARAAPDPVFQQPDEFDDLIVAGADEQDAMEGIERSPRFVGHTPPDIAQLIRDGGAGSPQDASWLASADDNADGMFAPYIPPPPANPHANILNAIRQIGPRAQDVFQFPPQLAPRPLPQQPYGPAMPDATRQMYAGIINNYAFVTQNLPSVGSGQVAFFPQFTVPTYNAMRFAQTAAARAANAYDVQQGYPLSNRMPARLAPWATFNWTAPGLDTRGQWGWPFEVLGVPPDHGFVNHEHDLGDFFTPCSHLQAEVLREHDNGHVPCRNSPSSACEATHDHARNHTADPMMICDICHDNQERYWLPIDAQFIAQSKAYVCQPCANVLVQQQTTWVYCRCAIAIRNSWLCHGHRENVEDERKPAIMTVDEWLIRAGIIIGRGIPRPEDQPNNKCVACHINNADPSSKVAACKICRDWIQEYV